MLSHNAGMTIHAALIVSSFLGFMSRHHGAILRDVGQASVQAGQGQLAGHGGGGKPGLDFGAIFQNFDYAP